MKRIIITFACIGILLFLKRSGGLPNYGWDAIWTLVVSMFVVLVVTLVHKPVTQFVDRPVLQRSDDAKMQTLRRARLKSHREFRVYKRGTSISVEGRIVQMSVSEGTFTLRYGNPRVYAYFHIADIDQIEVLPTRSVPEPQIVLADDSEFSVAQGA
jgi:hypothetical protein